MDNTQKETPFLWGVLRYLKADPLPFHVPGHKGGKGMDPEFRELLGSRALALDLTNIAPLDSTLHEAQTLAAITFGANHTWFSVQGTTTPLMAMIMAVCSPGESIILPRNIHRSVLSGLILSGAKPIFLHTPVDPDLGIHHAVTPEQVKEALELYPEAKAVLMIHPTYYGFASNLTEIVHIAHEHGVPVLVDEAHGSHFHFHEKLPPSAMASGADLVASSVHKLGGSLTGSSCLHLQGDRISPQRMETMLNTLTTTSASFLLLASLDAARRHLACHGRTIVDRAIQLGEEARARINMLPSLWCPGKELISWRESVYATDPTKVLVHVRNLGISGQEAERWLCQHFRIQVELSDLQNILCIITGGDSEQSINRLVESLDALSRYFGPFAKKQKPLIIQENYPLLALTPREAFYANTGMVSLEESMGQIVAECVMTYPPGIPLILPGEIMDQATYNYIRSCQEWGLMIQGAEDGSLGMIRVVRGD